MHEFSRSDRVGAEIQRMLAQLIRDGMKDPRVGMVSVQEVRVTRDLAHAKVYFSLLDPADAKATAKVLNGAAGYLRRQLAHQLDTRTVPELQFVYDKSIDEGQRLSALIERAVETDRSHHQEQD